MRFCFIPFLVFYSLALAAQSEPTVSNGWQVSFSFSPQLRRDVALRGLLQEIDSSIPVPPNRRLLPDTITIAGTERFFERLPNRVQAEATETDFWFGGQLSVHRRFGRNFDWATGLYFSNAGYNSRTDEAIQLQDLDNTNTNNSNFLYSVVEVEARKLGLNTNLSYHLFPEKRIHPYFGFGINALLHRQQTRFLGRLYTGSPEVLLPQAAGSDLPTVTTTTLDIDFMSTAGVLCRLTDRWLVGVDLTTRSNYGRGLIGGQIRYWL